LHSPKQNISSYHVSAKKSLKPDFSSIINSTQIQKLLMEKNEAKNKEKEKKISPFISKNE